MIEWKQMNEWKWMNKKDECMNEWKDEYINEWIYTGSSRTWENERMNISIGGWMNEYIPEALGHEKHETLFMSSL